MHPVPMPPDRPRPTGDPLASARTSADLAEDLALLARLRAGDERAAASFAERLAPPLFRFARARLVGESELARDVVQTTLLKALSKLDGYRGEAPLLAWLLACCRNEIRMHLRRRRSAPREVKLEEVVEAPLVAERGPDAEAVLLARESAEHVHLALDALPPRYAAALEWKYLDQLSVEEIGARLAIGTKAAESLLTRARNSFRDYFGQLAAGRTPTGEPRR